MDDLLDRLFDVLDTIPPKSDENQAPAVAAAALVNGQSGRTLRAVRRSEVPVPAAKANRFNQVAAPVRSKRKRLNGSSTESKSANTEFDSVSTLLGETLLMTPYVDYARHLGR